MSISLDVARTQSRAAPPARRTIATTSNVVVSQCLPLCSITIDYLDREHSAPGMTAQDSVLMTQKQRILRAKLMERLDRACRFSHFAKATRGQYTRWVEQFLRFHRHSDGTWTPPDELRGREVAAFLTHMAVERRLSESSQNQALCAIVFLYEHVLEELPQDHRGGIRALGSICPK